MLRDSVLPVRPNTSGAIAAAGLILLLTACQGAPATEAPTAAPVEPSEAGPAAPTEALPTEALPTASATIDMPTAESWTSSPPTPDENGIIEVTPLGGDETQGGNAASYGGVTFRFDPALTDEVSGQTVPAEDAGEEGPYWANVPEHLLFRFEGYTLANTFHQPELLVYPIADYEVLVPEVADIAGSLQTLLDERPSDPADALPFLPMFNAGQVFTSQVAYVDFQNGSGVRYLTQYAQSLTVINNHELFYTFQGLTDDGQTYVAAILPVSSPELPVDGMETPGDDYDAWAEDYLNYIDGIATTLNSQPPESYTPSLSTLDAMIATLSVQN